MYRAIFYIAFAAISGSEMGLWQFGTIVNTQCILVVLIQVSLEFRSWTVFHLLSILASVAMYLVIGSFYSTVSMGAAHLIMHRCLASPMLWPMFIPVHLVIGAVFMLREIESSLLLAKNVILDTTRLIVYINLSASKKDSAIILHNIGS